MDILKVMNGLWLTASIKQKLMNMWVPVKDLEWVDFNNMNSINQLAQKIMPNLLRKNPQIAKQIKESNWLEWKTKEDVAEVIDSI